MPDSSRPKRPRVIVTRQLMPHVEGRMAELFDVSLSARDEAFTRDQLKAAVADCDLVVVLARGDVEGLVAARAQVGGLPSVPLGVVGRRGEVGGVEASRVVGCRLLGTLPRLPRLRRPLDPHRLPGPPARVAAGVLSGLVGPATVRRGRHALAVPA